VGVEVGFDVVVVLVVVGLEDVGEGVLDVDGELPPLPPVGVESALLSMSYIVINAAASSP
jgi:hypothetical protein